MDNATIWTKRGGVNGAIGSLREGRKDHRACVIETSHDPPGRTYLADQGEVTMKLYFVRRKDDGAYLEWNRVVQHWVFSREEATL